MEDLPTIKVSSLIDKLKNMPQDKKVIIEGCDCFGPACDVEYSKEDDYVYIFRNQEDW